MTPKSPSPARRPVERVQTGVRLEKRLLKVTKALADSLDLTLGDLLEGVLLHALEGKAPFSPATLARAAQLKDVFGLDLARRGCPPPHGAQGASLAVTVMTADERAFVDAFQDGSLPTERFHHRDHVHMAWLYLREHGPQDAVARFSGDLRTFARAKGVPGLFHATITWAYFALVAERLRGVSHDAWDDFAAANADLLTWKPSILDAYYTPERLWSDVAREMFVLPDRVAPGVGPQNQSSKRQESSVGP